MSKLGKAQKAVASAIKQTERADNVVNTVKDSGGTVSETLAKNASDARRALKANTMELGSARGEVVNSTRNLVSKWGEVLGVTRGKTGVNDKKLIEKAAGLLEKEGRATPIQRLFSKPIRIAARFPKLSLITGGLVAVVGAGTYVHNRASRRTEEQTIAALQMPVQMPAPVAEANVTYQASPEEVALMESRMRGTGATRTGHADAVIAAREAAAQQAQTAVGPTA